MSWFVTNTIDALLLPPLSLFLLLALGLFQAYRRRRFAKPLIVAAFALLWLASTPYVAEGGLHLLEARTAPLGKQDADAIVILGSGTYFHAPEYGGQDTVSEAALLRLRYGARLHRETGKPILVTGGKPLGNALSEAQLMRAALEQDFQVPVRWTEDDSANTYENAHYSFRILQQAGIRKVYVVTHAWHMKRSLYSFAKEGLTIHPGSVAYIGPASLSLARLQSNEYSYEIAWRSLREMIGLIWYRWLY